MLTNPAFRPTSRQRVDNFAKNRYNKKNMMENTGKQMKGAIILNRQKGIAFFLAFFLVLSLLPFRADAAEIGKKEFDEALLSLQQRFRSGEYWNAYNPCGYEGTGTIMCPDEGCKKRGHCYDTENKRGCPCLCGAFEYEGYTAYQCFGFACKMGNAVFGGNPAFWEKPGNTDNLSAGDILYGNLSAVSPNAFFHAIFITDISGDTVSYADCNAGAPCLVTWEKQTTRQAIRNAVQNGATLYHAPNNKTNQSQTVPPIAYTPVDTGVYCLKNMATGEILTVAPNSNGLLCTMPYTEKDQLKTAVTAAGTGYRLKPFSGADKLISADQQKKLFLDKDQSELWQRWRFEPANGGYLIHNAENPGVVLSTEKTTVILSEKTGKENQIWQLLPMQTPVISMLPGDLNCDGEITAADAVLLKRKLARWQVDIDERATDFNKDGKTTAVDAVLLSRFLAKWHLPGSTEASNIQ